MDQLELAAGHDLQTDIGFCEDLPEGLSHDITLKAKLAAGICRSDCHGRKLVDPVTGRRDFRKLLQLFPNFLQRVFMVFGQGILLVQL